MVLAFAITLVCILCVALSLPVALLVIAFGAAFGCAGLACTCPRHLKDDSLFQSDVL